MPEPHTIQGTTPVSPPDSYCSMHGFSIRCILSFPDSNADNSLCSYTGSDPGRQYQTPFPQAGTPANVYMPHQKKADLSLCLRPHPDKPRLYILPPLLAANDTTAVLEGTERDDPCRLRRHPLGGISAPVSVVPDEVRDNLTVRFILILHKRKEQARNPSNPAP